MKNIFSTFAYISLYLTATAFVAVVYLVLAAYWDDFKEEYLIYNYNWDFRIIDFFVWRAVPIAALILFFIILTRLLNMKK